MNWHWSPLPPLELSISVPRTPPVDFWMHFGHLVHSIQAHEALYLEHQWVSG
jgi:hypothetical protein